MKKCCVQGVCPQFEQGASYVRWRALPAESFVAASKRAATWFYALPVGAVTFADVIIPLLLVGAARELASQLPVLAANTAGHCVAAASWYRALPLLAVLPAVPIRFQCVCGAFFMSAHPVRVVFQASASGCSKGSAASFPAAHRFSAAAVLLTQPF